MGSTISCPSHGDRQKRMVCDHIFRLRDSRIRFEYVLSDDAEAAWCTDCDTYLIKAGGWTKEAEDYAKPHLICNVCFEAALVGNIRLEV